jgi:hypothetical protein
VNAWYAKAWFAAAAIAASSVGAQAQTVKRFHLDLPGAMERLQAGNPDHYRKVEAILAGLSRCPAASDAADLLRVKFEARDVFVSAFFRTSYPAKRDVSFVLDDTRYVGRLAMDQPINFWITGREPSSATRCR